MADMVHYFATFELPDGEHLMHGWSPSMSDAQVGVSRIIAARNARVPKETATIKRLWQVAPANVDAEIEKEDARIRAAYPDRLHAGDMFEEPNLILEKPVLPESE